MRRFSARVLLVASLFGAFTACGPSHPAVSNTMSKLTYPAAARSDVVDDYHGTKVPDPYRWMEDLDAKATADWVAASNAVTEPYLAGLPHRQTLNARLTELWNYPRVGLPDEEAGQLFYTKNTGLQRQAPLYVRSGRGGEPRVVIDPNAISEDGSLSLAQWEPSPNGKWLAYGLSQGGADWQTIKVRDVTTGQELRDEVKWMRFSEIAWTADSLGFYYSRYPEPPANKTLEAALSGQALYYHTVGTPQSADVLIYDREDLPAWIINGMVSEDGRYLIVVMAEGSGNRNRFYAADLGNPMHPKIDAPIKPVIEADDAEYWPIGNSGPIFFLRHDKGAPNRKIIAVDVRNPTPANWKTIVPEQKEALEAVAVISGHIVAQYLVDVQSRLSLFGLDGTPRGEIALPGAGSVDGIGGREGGKTVWYSFTAPLSPLTVYSYDPATKQSTPFEPPQVPMDTSRFETKAMFAMSRDGTRVPFFLTAKKGLALDGSDPTMLYGYGGFSVTMLPTYRSDVPAWLEMGGVWVTVSMRGGAEYGEAWHDAGKLEKKQNVFDDFIAVAEHLVREQYTSPAKLGMMGGSNGGLLVGAVMEQRPDLFAVALPQVGVMDMLRYDRFTGGRLWVTEYGSASDPRQFPFLVEYSPLHNIKPGTCYPATLITTADHDDRVVPSHSFKFAAALQAAQGCDKPVLIRVEVQGSHGYRPTDKLIAERADMWAFAAANMGMAAPAE
jgi:prolyl oligopeptidase